MGMSESVCECTLGASSHFSGVALFTSGPSTALQSRLASYPPEAAEKDPQHFLSALLTCLPESLPSALQHSARPAFLQEHPKKG